MTDRLLLHPRTGQKVSGFLQRPPHAILITGQPGSGKSAIAHQLAAAVLGIEAEKLADYPYFIRLEKPEGKQEIPIEAARQLMKEMRLKPAVAKASGPAKRAVLIEGAASLSEEAQNALLKTMEEPSGETIFILTADSDTDLLPTIASRTQKLAVSAVSREHAVKYYGKCHTVPAIDSAWRLSRGAAGLMSALLEDDNAHPLKQAVDEAKRFLQMDRFERTVFLDSLSADKLRLAEFLDALSRILGALHQSAIGTGRTAQLKRISAARRAVSSASDSLRRNASPKLLGLHLALSLPL